MGLKVAVIVTGDTAPTRAAKEATSTIPIVMAQDNDPVANGVVASLARPGGNITGLTNFAPELDQSDPGYFAHSYVLSSDNECLPIDKLLGQP